MTLYGEVDGSAVTTTFELDGHHCDKNRGFYTVLLQLHKN